MGLFFGRMYWPQDFILTAREEEILRYVTEAHQKTGSYPDHREISEQLPLSLPTVRQYIHRLIDKHRLIPAKAKPRYAIDDKFDDFKWMMDGKTHLCRKCETKLENGRMQKLPLPIGHDEMRRSKNYWVEYCPGCLEREDVDSVIK